MFEFGRQSNGSHQTSRYWAEQCRCSEGIAATGRWPAWCLHQSRLECLWMTKALGRTVDDIATAKNFRGIRQCDWHQNLPTENGSQRCWCMKSNRVLWSWPTVSESDTPRGVRFGGRDSIGGRRIPTLVMDCRRTNAGQPSQQTTGQAFETADRLAKNLHHHESLAVRNQPPSPRQLQLQSRYTIELRWRLERLGPWYGSTV